MKFLFLGVIKKAKKNCNMLNCKLDVFPISYLGILISNQHLGVRAFDPANIKVV